MLLFARLRIGWLGIGAVTCQTTFTMGLLGWQWLEVIPGTRIGRSALWRSLSSLSASELKELTSSMRPGLSESVASRASHRPTGSGTSLTLSLWQPKWQILVEAPWNIGSKSSIWIYLAQLCKAMQSYAKYLNWCQAAETSACQASWSAQRSADMCRPATSKATEASMC